MLGPYKGYGAVPSAPGNGNGAKPNGKWKYVGIRYTVLFIVTFSIKKALKNSISTEKLVLN